MSIAKSRKLREKSGTIILEGRRLIQDALEAGVKLESLFFSRSESLDGLSLDPGQNFHLYKVLYSHMSLWSDLTTSPGIIGKSTAAYSRSYMRAKYGVFQNGKKKMYINK